MQTAKRKITKAAAFEILTNDRHLQIYLLLCAGFVLFLKSLALEGLTSTYYFNAYELTETQGKVRQIIEIESDDDSVFEIEFEFSDEFGAGHTNISFTKRHRLSKGDAVAVQYVMSAPQFARIKGFHYQKNAPWEIGLFMLMLLGIHIWPLKRLWVWRRQLHLLRTGMMTSGAFKSCIETKMQQNEQSLFRVTFTFKDINQQPQEVSELTLEHDFDKQADYDVFYDAEQPARALVFQLLNGDTRLVGQTEIAASQTNDYRMLTIVPLIYLSCWFIWI